MTERQEDDWWHGFDPEAWPAWPLRRVPDAERPVDVDDEEERDR